MLLGVAVAAAKMLGVLPGVDAPPVVGVPTVLTDKLPGGGFLTGTTTLLLRMRHNGVKINMLLNKQIQVLYWLHNIIDITLYNN